MKPYYMIVINTGKKTTAPERAKLKKQLTEAVKTFNEKAFVIKTVLTREITTLAGELEFVDDDLNQGWILSNIAQEDLVSLIHHLVQKKLIESLTLAINNIIKCYESEIVSERQKQQILDSVRSLDLIDKITKV